MEEMNIDEFVLHIAKDMKSQEDHEIIIWNEPLRNAAMRYTLNCLANPECEGSQRAIDAILDKRKSK